MLFRAIDQSIAAVLVSASKMEVQIGFLCFGLQCSFLSGTLLHRSALHTLKA